eukprot:12646197-Alexandrium_andersonii.AAC.1
MLRTVPRLLRRTWRPPPMPRTVPRLLCRLPAGRRSRPGGAPPRLRHGAAFWRAGLALAPAPAAGCSSCLLYTSPSPRD